MHDKLYDARGVVTDLLLALITRAPEDRHRRRPRRYLTKRTLDPDIAWRKSRKKKRKKIVLLEAEMEEESERKEPLHWLVRCMHHAQAPHKFL